MRWIKLFEGYFSDKRKEIEDDLESAKSIYEVSKRKLMDEVFGEVRDNLDFLLDEFTTGEFEYSENEILIDLTFRYSDIDKFCELEWKFINLFDKDDFKLYRRISFRENETGCNIHFYREKEDIGQKYLPIYPKELKKAINKNTENRNWEESTIIDYTCSIVVNYVD
jgi:hypothetical protein